MNRRALLISLAGHAGLILVVLVIQGASGRPAPLGGDAIWVDMVTVGEPSNLQETHVDSNPEDGQETVPDDTQVEPVDAVQVPEDGNPVDDTQVEHVGTTDDAVTQNPDHVVENPDSADPQETPSSTDGYIGVDAAGEPGGGAPGPATYEGRVFSAIRRNFRTATEPTRSYQIEITVRSDGSVDIDTIRKSGVDVFDRAVEHALAMAQIPPFPPGRTSPAVLRIEFLGLAVEQ